MGSAVRAIAEHREHNISNYMLAGHAMAQYMAKIKPGLSLIEVTGMMRRKMCSVKLVDLNKETRNKRTAYMDEDETVYITEKNKVITVFPNERIWVAKTMYSNRKTGNKYL